MRIAVNRRLVVVVAVVLAGLAVLGAGAVQLLFPSIARWVVATRVIPRLERQYGVSLGVGTVAVGFGQLRLDNVTVAAQPARDGRPPVAGGLAGAPVAGGLADPPIARVATVRAEFDFLAALRGRVRIGEVRVERPEVQLVRTADGRDNWSSILARLRRRRPGGDGGPGIGPVHVLVSQGSVTFEDRRHGLRGSIQAFQADVRRGGPATMTVERARAESAFGPQASVDRVRLAAHLSDLEGTAVMSVEGGIVALWPDLSLTGIAGRIGVSGEPGRLQIRLAGGYGGVEGVLWHAEGWLDPRARDADLRLRADRFTLDRLASILRGTPIQEPQRTSIETNLDVEVRGGEVGFRGALGISDLTLYHPWLADEPVRNLSFHGEVDGRFSGRSRQLEISSLDVEFRGIAAHLEAMAALPGGELETGDVRTRARLAAHLVVPPVACQAVLDALPPELTPQLAGLRASGRFTTDVRVDIDWANLDALVLEGSVGIAACRATAEPDALSRLRDQFEHQVEVEKDNWLAFTVGPANPDFVAFPEISPHLVNSLMTTEDSGFYHHRGFIPREFRSALIRNLKEGYFKYGASSITMQLVKNVLLYRQKTLARKLQELVLTHFLEQAIDKDRILEIYLNVIEFGPGIYGIGPAARHYFGKAALDLGPVEAAFFSSILPNPKERHLQYCEGQLSRWGDGKVQRILKVMRDRERLTEEEYQAALTTPLVFDRTDASSPIECEAMTRRIMRNARPTTPPRLGPRPPAPGTPQRPAPPGPAPRSPAP